MVPSQDTPVVPAITVNAPVLLKTLTILRRAILEKNERVLDGPAMKEVEEICRQIEDEVLSPKWTRQVKEEVIKVFKED